MWSHLVFVIIFATYYSNGALLFWSKHKFEVSPLKDFNDDNFNELVEDLGNPTVKIYKSSTGILQPKFKELLKGYHSAYNPSGNINTENATEIFGDDETELLRIKEENDATYSNNVLSVIVIPNTNRIRREASIFSSTTTDVPYEPPKGPVLYKGQSKKDDTFGLLYSSQPLLLRANTSNLYLGNTSPDLITVDTVARESYSRLNVNIPLEEGGKVTLRFIFAWKLSGYWTLTAVKITDTNNNLAYDLSPEMDITAPAHFSYHCNGDAVFTNSSHNVELYVYNLQVQIDSNNGKFDDAYDCVDFTTPTIWSGLFVTALLSIGLVIALSAISDIKTMDKFDNQKTKQLAITVTE